MKHPYGKHQWCFSIYTVFNGHGHTKKQNTTDEFQNTEKLKILFQRLFVHVKNLAQR